MKKYVYAKPKECTTYKFDSFISANHASSDLKKASERG